MKKLLFIIIGTFLVSGGLSFLILFEGDTNQVKIWWAKWT